MFYFSSIKTKLSNLIASVWLSRTPRLDYPLEIDPGLVGLQQVQLWWMLMNSYACIGNLMTGLLGWRGCFHCHCWTETPFWTRAQDRHALWNWVWSRSPDLLALTAISVWKKNDIFSHSPLCHYELKNELKHSTWMKKEERYLTSILPSLSKRDARYLLTFCPAFGTTGIKMILNLRNVKH